MDKNIDKVREKKNLVIALVLIFVVFAIFFVMLTRDTEEEVVDEKTPEETLTEQQTDELKTEMEEFEPLTEDDIEVQTQELENLFETMK